MQITMSKITKEVKCITCGSYIHNTERCYIWRNTIFCRTSHTWNRECNCVKCVNRCQYCNDYLCVNGVCYNGHNGERCLECNEFLKHGNNECRWDHTKLLCQFCNLPIYRHCNECINMHRSHDPICPECELPVHPSDKHGHDGVKCKVCNSLLNGGKCIYKCVDGGNICIYCNIEGVYDNYCWFCKKNNSGQFTKRAIK